VSASQRACGKCWKIIPNKPRLLTLSLTVGRFSPFFEPEILEKPRKRIWRKGWFLNPFCHLVIMAIRWDSHPLPDSLSKVLIAYRLRNKMAKNTLAAKLDVSLGTLKNWEFGRTHPNRKSWPAIRTLLGT